MTALRMYIKYSKTRRKFSNAGFSDFDTFLNFSLMSSVQIHVLTGFSLFMIHSPSAVSQRANWGITRKTDVVPIGGTYQ
jgi:hypothetical protein